MNIKKIIENYLGKEAPVDWDTNADYKISLGDVKQIITQLQAKNLHKPHVTSSKWFQINQISSGNKTLIVLHQHHSEDKKELIDQLKTMIMGIETNFKWFPAG